jgi:xylulokinase
MGEKFDQHMLEDVGIDTDILPGIFRCEDIAGELTSEAAAATGLVPGIPVAVGQVDFNASCISAGVTEEGDIMSNLGTVGNFGIVFKNPDFMFSPEGLAMITTCSTYRLQKCRLAVKV